MNGEDVPRCVACDCDLAVEHNLFECGDFAEVRQRYYEAENLQQLFREISVTDIFDFLWEIRLFYSERSSQLRSGCERSEHNGYA